MDRKGTISIIFKLAIGLAVLSVLFIGAQKLHGQITTLGEATNCGVSGTGICDEICGQGFTETEITKCPGILKCCIPEEDVEKEAERKKQFQELAQMLMACYQQGEDSVYCNTATIKAKNVLLKRDPDLRLSFALEGDSTFMQFQRGSFNDENTEPISQRTLPFAMCADQLGFDRDQGLIEIYVDGGVYKHDAWGNNNVFNSFIFKNGKVCVT